MLMTASIPVTDALSAVVWFTQCVLDIAEWLCVSLLCLNPAEMLVIWLGSRQHVYRVTAYDINVL